ncbi:MAG: hypothetical protein AAB783_02685 [Patescibacteria group bacterium]
MTAKRIIFIVFFFIVFISALMVGIRDYLPKLVKISEPLTTKIQDTQDFQKICRAILPRAHSRAPNHTCVVKNFMSVVEETNIDRECVDGSGAAGCVVCTYECRWILPKVFDQVHF